MIFTFALKDLPYHLRDYVCDFEKYWMFIKKKCSSTFYYYVFFSDQSKLNVFYCSLRDRKISWSLQDSSLFSGRS